MNVAQKMQKALLGIMLQKKKTGKYCYNWYKNIMPSDCFKYFESKRYNKVFLKINPRF